MRRERPHDPHPPTALGGLIVLGLFSLPFVGAGGVMLVKGVTFLLRHNLNDGLPLTLGGVVFSAAGGLILTLAFAGRKTNRQLSQARIEHPDAPWLWRADWAAGVLPSQTGRTAVFHWVFALIWNALSSTVLVALPKELAKGNQKILIGLIFPLVGLGLLAAAIYVTIVRRKYGVPTLKLITLPGVLGGQLRAVIQLDKPMHPEADIRLHLLCLHRYRSGKNTREAILWEREKRLRKEVLEVDGRSLPVCFDLPYDGAEGDAGSPGGLGIRWVLKAKAATPGADFAAQFDVPVFKTEESQVGAPPRRDPAADYQVAGPMDVGRPQSSVPVEPAPEGGRVYRFAAFRNRGAALSLLAFAVVWSAVTYFLIKTKAPLVFPIAFGGSNLIMLFACWNLLVVSRRAVVGPQGVTVETHWGLAKTRRRFEAREVAGFESKMGMTHGQKCFYNLQVRLANKRKHTLGTAIPSGSDAEWLVADMTAALAGRPSDPA
jgi:hypothetical protein